MFQRHSFRPRKSSDLEVLKFGGAGLGRRPEEATLTLLAALFLRSHSLAAGSLSRLRCSHCDYHRRSQTENPEEKGGHAENRRWRKAHQGPRGPPGRSRESCSDDEKRTAGERAEGFEGRGESSHCESAATTMKKKTSKKKPADPAARKKIARPSSSSAKRIVGIRELGETINLRERRIYMLRDEGMPKISPGKYDLRACLRWYFRYLQRKIVERAYPKTPNSADAASATRHGCCRSRSR